TELSFCLPTSLAFAKRLTWEQTPWIRFNVNNKSANPINESDAYLISQYLASHVGTPVTPAAIQNALLFGSTYPSSPCPSDPHLRTSPRLFVVFPHATTNPSRDEKFLKIWHDEIVKPAFDCAWNDSGLTPIYGAPMDGQTHILPPTGTRTERDAFPASGFLTRLRRGDQGEVRAYWPAWEDNWGLGNEGRYTGVRRTIYTEAWAAIKGMLKDHPQLASYQNPILLALCRGVVYVNARLNTQDKFKSVAQEWDALVDSRFIKPGSFKVVFEMIVGTQAEGVRQLAMEQQSKPG
ncbi:hypothetical protein BDW02DRAFT_481595, partial [Decorospora gaudefroyi]